MDHNTHFNDIGTEHRLLRLALSPGEREPAVPSEEPRQSLLWQMRRNIDALLSRNGGRQEEEIPYAVPANDPDLHPHPNPARRSDVQGLKKTWWGRPFLSLGRSSSLSMDREAADRMQNLSERLYQRVDKTRYEVLRSADRSSRNLLTLFYKRDLLRSTIAELESGIQRIKRYSAGLKDELDGQYRRFNLPNQSYLAHTHEKRTHELRTLLAGVEEQITKATSDTDGLPEVQRDHEELVRLLKLGGMNEQDAQTMARENALGSINLEREMKRHRVMLTGGRAEWKEVLRLGASLRMHGWRFFQRFSGRETKDRRQAVRTFYTLMLDPSIEREWREWIARPSSQDLATPSELQRQPSPADSEPPMGMAA